MQITMVPIGFVRGGRTEPTKDGWGSNRCRLVLEPDIVTPAALLGVADLSHIEVVFYFHVDAHERPETGARRPRGRADLPAVGIFAQRGRMRPNRIGVSICRVRQVSDLEIEVEGLDAIDGTPLLDLKPVWSGYAPRGKRVEPAWARELMAHYW